MTTQDWLRLFWAMYLRALKAGCVVGLIAYGFFQIGMGSPLAIIITAPLVVVFCLVVSVPAAGLGVLFAKVIGRLLPRATELEWRLLGSPIGAATVVVPMVYFSVTAGALGSSAGVMFWATFIVASAIGGDRIALEGWQALGSTHTAQGETGVSAK